MIRVDTVEWIDANQNTLIRARPSGDYYVMVSGTNLVGIRELRDACNDILDRIPKNNIAEMGGQRPMEAQSA